MRRRSAAWRVFVLATGTACALAGAARGETIEVPRDQATIQAAVDASGPGDVIVVKAGTYRESVVVSGCSHRYVQIYSDGQVVIEGRGVAPAITVRSAKGIGIHGFTVHSGGDGVSITKSGDVTVDGLTATDCPGTGIRVDASADVTLQWNVVSGAGGSGVAITATHYVTVNANVFSDIGADGLTVTGGTDVYLCGNDVTDCGASGVSCTGVGQLVIDETHIDGIVGNAITVSHSGEVAILSNDLGDHDPATTIGGDAVHVESSAHVTVEVNAITDVAGAGVSVSGPGATIQSNTILDVGGTGVQVGGTANTYVGQNVIERPRGSGVVVDGESSSVVSNRISFAGFDGVAVHGGDNYVASNIVYRSANDGVCVTNAAGDAGVVVRDNLVTRPGGDGLDLGATCESRITGNTVSRAHGNGIAMTTGAGNVLDANQATRSRGFDLFEGSDPVSNEVGPTNRFKKMNKRHRHRK